MLSLVGPDCLRHYKVLPGGQQLSVLFGYPQSLAYGRASRKFFEAGGTAFNTNLAHVTASATQVEHVVSSTFDLEETLLDGDPQVIDSPFKCEEGLVETVQKGWECSVWWMSTPEVQQYLSNKSCVLHTYTIGPQATIC
jgi:hypothetical protein